MIVNNLQNPYSINEIYASKPLRNESSSLSANSMPTTGRIVNETGVPKRALNNKIFVIKNFKKISIATK